MARLEVDTGKLLCLKFLLDKGKFRLAGGHRGLDAVEFAARIRQFVQRLAMRVFDRRERFAGSGQGRIRSSQFRFGRRQAGLNVGKFHDCVHIPSSAKVQ